MTALLSAPRAREVREDTREPAPAPRTEASAAPGPGAGGRGLRLSLMQRISAIIAVFVLVIVSVGAVAVTTTRSISDDADALAAVQRGAVAPLTKVHQGQLKARLIVAQVAAASSQERADEWLDKQAENDAETDAAIAQLRAALAGTETRATTGMDEFLEWREVRDAQVIPAALATDGTVYETVLTTVSQPLIDAYLVDLDAAAVEAEVYSAGLAEDAQSTGSTGFVVIVVVSLVGIALGAVTAIVIARAITRSTVAVQRSLEALAEGDLTLEPQVTSRDEIGAMASALVTAQRSLRDVLGGVADSARNVSDAAQDMRAGATQVTTGSEESSAQIGVVAAAAEQVSRNVQTVAAGAEDRKSVV